MYLFRLILFYKTWPIKKIHKKTGSSAAKYITCAVRALNASPWSSIPFSEICVSLTLDKTHFKTEIMMIPRCRYFQHAHFIPMVGGKERRISVGPW